MVDETPLLLLAARQHGVFEIGQARELGLDDHAVARRVRRGVLERTHPGVYRVAGAPVTHEQRLLAACLAAGPDAAVSHRAAAQEWGLASFPDVVEIVTPRRQWPRLRGVRVHRSSDLAPGHVTWRRRIPVTKPVRTLVDLGAVAPYAVADGLERGLASRLFGLAAADAALDEFGRKGRTGVGVFRAVVDQRALGADVPESLLEARMARLLREHDLPPPAFQFWVTPDIRVDFAYPDLRLVIEVDGFGVHGTASAMAADFVRQNRLAALGWTVLRFTWHQVVTQPEVVARAVLVTLDRRNHEPA